MVFPNLDLTAIAQSIAQAADEKCNGREVISVGPMTLMPAGAELHYAVVFVVPTLGNENYAGDQITPDTNRNEIIARANRIGLIHCLEELFACVGELAFAKHVAKRWPKNNHMAASVNRLSLISCLEDHFVRVQVFGIELGSPNGVQLERW